MLIARIVRNVKSPVPRAFALPLIREIEILVYYFFVRVVTLHSFEAHMASLAALGVFCIPPLAKILLGGGGKDELLVTFATNQNPRLEPILHQGSPSQRPPPRSV